MTYSVNWGSLTPRKRGVFGVERFSKNVELQIAAFTWRIEQKVIPSFVKLVCMLSFRIQSRSRAPASPPTVTSPHHGTAAAVAPPKPVAINVQIPRTSTDVYANFAMTLF